jgi:uncharacterized protein YhbP (UPF0306 family)
MPDRSDIERVIAANRYMAISTIDEDAKPWATPVFFGPFGDEQLYWVSSPASRHSRNIAERPNIAITVFGSTVAIGRAEAVYFEARAAKATAAEILAALPALNDRLPEDKTLSARDLQPIGPLALFRADIVRRFVLVRGGDPMTVASSYRLLSRPSLGRCQTRTLT